MTVMTNEVQMVFSFSKIIKFNITMCINLIKKPIVLYWIILSKFIPYYLLYGLLDWSMIYPSKSCPNPTLQPEYKIGPHNAQKNSLGPSG